MAQIQKAKDPTLRLPVWAACTHAATAEYYTVVLSNRHCGAPPSIMARTIWCLSCSGLASNGSMVELVSVANPGSLPSLKVHIDYAVTILRYVQQFGGSTCPRCQEEVLPRYCLVQHLSLRHSCRPTLQDGLGSAGKHCAPAVTHTRGRPCNTFVKHAVHKSQQDQNHERTAGRQGAPEKSCLPPDATMVPP